MQQSHRVVLDEQITWRERGFPDVAATVGSVREHGWTLADLALPMLLLRDDALEHNLKAMADYCERHGVELAPHGKTHLSPQLWWRQQDAGAWAVTVASVAQAKVFVAGGARRILIANEVVAAGDLEWIAGVQDDGVEVLLCVDSHAAVDRIVEHMRDAEAPVQVLIELGYRGGRAGCRTTEQALSLAQRISGEPGLRLRGVEGFEGVMPGEGDGQRRAIAGYLESAAQLLDAMISDGYVEEPIATFGGSAHFDLVIGAFTRRSWSHDAGVRVILRSGCYLTHDHGLYANSSPTLDGTELEPALELWAQVISTPEPGLAIANFGKRDASFDAGLPVPLTVGPPDARRQASGITIERLSDQHAHLRLVAGTALAVGELIAFGISHPCTAFDKWRLIPVVDRNYRVVDAVKTYF